MPTTDSAIRACLDLVDRIGVKACTSTTSRDPFEDNFPVTGQGDRKLAFIREWWPHRIDPPGIRFSGKTPGFKPVEIGDSSFDYFLHFFTPGFLRDACAATNENIERIRTEVPEEASSLSCVSMEELLSFLGLLLLHFTVLGGVAEWLGDYGLPVGTCLTLSRFKFLLGALRFSQGSSVEGILKHFNDRMHRISNPPKRLLLSDSAIVQGDSLMYSKFYDHPGHHGTLYSLSGQDGMVYRLCLKSEAVVPPASDFPNPVVGSLMNGLLDHGYSLYMNKYYCSVQLAEDLLERKTYCTGTVRNTRIIAPPEIHRAMPEQLLVSGRATHSATSYYTEDGICYTKWDEGREVLCISSEHGADMTGEDFPRPELFHEYTVMTAQAAPPTPRLAIMRCNADARLTLHVLALMLRNAYILRSAASPTTFSEFHFDVAKHLLAYPAPVSISPLIQSHLPALIEGVRHNSVLIPRKLCDSCAERAVVIFCKSCPSQPSLCPDCYKNQHEKISILVIKNRRRSDA